MAPLVRRTWSPRGQTPALAREGGRRVQVAVAGARGLSPRRVRLGLFARPLVNEAFDPWDSAAFLEALLSELTGRVVVVGDGGSRHKRDPIRQLEEVGADRLTWEKFPP